MIIEVKERDKFIFIYPKENLIGDIGSEFGDELGGVKDLAKDRVVVVNLEAINQIDSFTLSTLVAFGYDIKAEGSVLTFVSLHPFVNTIFKMMKMDQIFSIYESESELIDNFSKQE